MPEQEEIDQQFQLLNIHRRTLASQLQRLAKLGGLAYAPPEVVNSIAEARENIDRIKKTLRHWGVAYDEHLGDESGSAENRSPVVFLPNNLPTGYVERLGALAALRQALLSHHTSSGVVATAALHGLGGLGKTVLARAICDDRAIRATFPDGVLWATLGQSAEPARHQRDWIRTLGGDVTTASSLEGGKVELTRLLTDRAMLLVLDDVWNASDAEWLRAGGPRCVALITTRDATQAEGATLVELELMQRSESRALLEAAGARQLEPALADIITTRLGHLPLALKIVGALLAKRLPWADIAEALDEGDLAFLDHGQSSVLAAIKASLARLPADWATCYQELVIFPQDEPLAETAVARLWMQTAGLKPRQSRRLLADLRERALIQADNTLHDLQYDYLRAQVPPAERRRLHSSLADALSDSATGTPPPDDTYSWRRLAYHLARGERNDDLRGLLHNGAYLQGKIAQLGTTSLLEDFRLLPRDEEIERMAGALRLGAHILDQEPRELANQLFGRLGSLPELYNMPNDGKPRFVLESQTLTAPGGPLMHIMVGHTDAVASCVFSPDGKKALSASSDRTLRVWNVATGQPFRILEGHTSWVSSCSFSPDGRLALSASGDKTLRLWDVTTGQTLRILEGHSEAVNSCVFSPDGKLALSAAYDHTLRLWDVATGRTITVLEGHTDDVAGCVFSPDGQYALSASDDRMLGLWDLATNQLLRMLKGHTDVVRSCAFSPDGRLALSASGDKTLRLWDVATGETIRVLEGHVLGVTACIFSADGTLGLSASIDEDMRLWDIATGQSLRKLEVHSRHVTSCALSPDGQYALSASRDGTLRLSDIRISDLPTYTSDGHTSNVTSCTFNANGDLLLSASFDRNLRLWNAATRQSMRVLRGHAGWVNSCAFSPDGKFALSGSADRTLRLWEVATGQSLRVLKGHAGWVNSCAFSPDGKFALSCSADQTLRLWDLTSSDLPPCVLDGHIGYINCCALSPDGKFALSGSADQTLRLWDIASGQTLHILDGHTSTVYGCAFSPDGKLAASVSRDETVRLWSLASAETMCVLEGHTDRVYSCAFNSNGTLALSASWDRTVRLWDVMAGEEVAHWAADAYLMCCTFHPDDRHVIAGGYYGNVHWLRIEGI